MASCQEDVPIVQDAEVPGISTHDLSRADLAWLVAITVVAALLRFHDLAGQSFWIDEVLTYLSSRGSVWHVLTQTEVNTNIPPLYYLVVNQIMRLGNDEWILRSVSAIAGVLTIPIFFALSRRWLGTNAALVGTAFLAVSPFHVWYSQEARPYALLLLAALAAAWIQDRLLENWNLRESLLFVLAAAAVFLTHTIGLAFLAFLFLRAAMESRGQWRKWAVSFAVVVLLIVPGFLRLAAFPPTAAASEKGVGLLDLPYAFWTFSVGYSIGPSVAELHFQEASQKVMEWTWLIVPLALVFGGLAVAGGMRIWRARKESLQHISLWISTIVGVGLAGALFTSHPFNARYVVLAFPPFAMLVAAGLTGRERRPLRLLAGATATIAILVSLGNHYGNERYAKEDNRSAVSHIRQNSSGDDVLLVTVPYVGNVFQYYDPEMPTYLFPAREQQIDLAVSPLEALEQLPSSAERVWVYESRTFGQGPGSELIRSARDRFNLMEYTEFAGVNVALFELPPSEDR